MVNPLRYVSFQPVLHDWDSKGDVSYSVCRMVDIKRPLLIIRKSSPCNGGRGFPLSRYLSGSLSYAEAVLAKVLPNRTRATFIETISITAS